MEQVQFNNEGLAQQAQQEKRLLMGIVEALGPADVEFLDPIIKSLKQDFGGEGWACGEVIERTLRAREFMK